eukprot:TRINITY_DN4088_c0_g1_i2.p2 TRINITY_DN4088_c0_g1~~TRINITY_DN4088_c0_g1_i2.p2  ORF type:complete len:105 (-),score=32.94 TRINITY_DN4088_c0_g1_i2:193-507(-)
MTARELDAEKKRLIMLGRTYEVKVQRKRAIQQYKSQGVQKRAEHGANIQLRGVQQRIEKLELTATRMAAVQAELAPLQSEHDVTTQPLTNCRTALSRAQQAVVY